MKERRFAIASVYNDCDDRLKNKVEVPCTYVDGKGNKRSKVVKVTEAEKFLIESIAMRLFLDRKRYIKKEKLDGGYVRFVATLSVDI